jgi:hypothetical protein
MPLLVGIFTAIASWLSTLGTAVVAFFTVELLKWSASKAFWMFMLTFVLPILLYNLAVKISLSFMSVGMEMTQTAMGDISSGNSLVLHLTGMAGWMAQEIYLPQALSVYLTALGAKFIISFIPFAR